MKKNIYKDYMYNRNIIFGMFLVLLAIGKIIRYTLMKQVLVDTGVGHELISPILNSNVKFSLLDKESIATNTSANTILFFRTINLFNIGTYIGWEIYITIIWNMIIVGILLKTKKILSFKEFVFICLSIIVLNIFDFTLAKEPIQMLYFLLIYIVLNLKDKSSRFKLITSIFIVFVSAITFRAYYLLIVLFMVMTIVLTNFFVLGKVKIKLKDIILIFFIIGVTYSLIIGVMKVYMPEQYNEIIRVRLRTIYAASSMNSILKSTNTLLFAIDYIIMIVRMLFPIELMALGIKYIPYVIYQLVLTYFILVALKNFKSNSRTKNIALYVYIGFLFASGTFEPDFGSWIRHEIVLFPLILVIADIKKIVNKDEIKIESGKRTYNEKDDDIDFS